LVFGNKDGKQVIHRDLKAENILIKSKSEYKIKVVLSDYGFATKQPINYEFVGTAVYMAPEIIMGFEYTSKVDTWSIGILLFILLTGQPPFKG